MNPTLSANTVVVASSEQVSCAVGEESVILSFTNSVYYGVNAVGASVWKLLQQKRSVEELRDAVAEEYDVERERCERDLLELLGKMQAEGLIRVVAAEEERERCFPAGGCPMTGLSHAGLLCIVGLIFICVIPCQAASQTEKDPHRPACTSARCRQMEAFLKAHYCGQSPHGNGPDNGCEVRVPTKPQTASVLANFHCEYNESTHIDECKQDGQPSSSVRNIVVDQMRRLGLPLKTVGQIHFKVWKANSTGRLVVDAEYSHTQGVDLEFCQVIVSIDQTSNVLVLRKSPFKKTNADVPDLTAWSLVDLIDANGDGPEEIVLEGDEYEDHWLEVISLQDRSASTIFSGLGYYL